TEELGLLGGLEWAHDHGRTEAEAALAHALWQFWRARWRTNESLLHLPGALEAAAAIAAATGSRADALRALHLRLGYGQALAISGAAGEAKRGGEAEQLLRRSVGEARALDDSESESAALTTLGGLALQYGDLQQAEEEYRQILRIAESEQDLN